MSERSMSRREISPAVSEACAAVVPASMTWSVWLDDDETPWGIPCTTVHVVVRSRDGQRGRYTVWSIIRAAPDEKVIRTATSLLKDLVWHMKPLEGAHNPPEVCMAVRRGLGAELSEQTSTPEAEPVAAKVPARPAAPKEASPPRPQKPAAIAAAPAPASDQMSLF